MPAHMIGQLVVLLFLESSIVQIVDGSATRRLSMLRIVSYALQEMVNDRGIVKEAVDVCADAVIIVCYASQRDRLLTAMPGTVIRPPSLWLLARQESRTVY